MLNVLNEDQILIQIKRLEKVQHTESEGEQNQGEQVDGPSH